MAFVFVTQWHNPSYVLDVVSWNEEPSFRWIISTPWFLTGVFGVFNLLLLLGRHSWFPSLWEVSLSSPSGTASSELSAFSFILYADLLCISCFLFRNWNCISYIASLHLPHSHFIENLTFFPHLTTFWSSLKGTALLPQAKFQSTVFMT